MNLTEKIFAQTLLMAGGLETEQEVLLRTLCRAAEVALAAMLRKDIAPEECEEDFVAAASLYALASLTESREQTEGFTVGDVTVRKGKPGAAAECLRLQAQMVMKPYLQDGFAFIGV